MGLGLGVGVGVGLGLGVGLGRDGRLELPLLARLLRDSGIGGRHAGRHGGGRTDRKARHGGRLQRVWQDIARRRLEGVGELEGVGDISWPHELHRHRAVRVLHEGRSGLLHVRALAVDDDRVDLLFELLEKGLDERLRSKVSRYVLSRVRDVARDSSLL